MTTTGAQTLVVIAQQQPVALAKPLPQVANAFRETLCALNDHSRIEKSQVAYARSYDCMARDVSYKVGNQMLKLGTTGKHGLTPKLLPIHDGPNFVTNVAYPNVTIRPEADQEDTVHVNQLRHYVSPDQLVEPEEIPSTSQPGFPRLPASSYYYLHIVPASIT
uniref:Uncharacterized protein n=1 Tax=Romanomermis culicivorax TaxID=13658 RepID=A0A915JV99_ROMCU